MRSLVAPELLLDGMREKFAVSSTINNFDFDFEFEFLSFTRDEMRIVVFENCHKKV